jgi:hypothetical protein
MPNEYDDVVSQYVTPEEQAQRWITGTPQPNAEQAGKAVQLAPQVGLPPAVVNTDTPGYTAQVQQRRNAQIVSGDPDLAGVIRSPTDYEAVADDLPAIKKAKDTANGWADWTGWAGMVHGYRETNLGREAAAYQAGAGSLLPDILAKKKQLDDAPNYTGYRYVVNAAGNFIGGMLALAPEVATGTAGGFAMGGPVGAGIGATTGLTVGLSATTSGNIYLTTDQFRGPNGERIPEITKQLASITGGAVVGMLGGKMGAESAEATSALVTDVVSKLAGDRVVAGTLTRMAGAAGRSGLTVGGLNASMTAAQAIAPQIARAVTDPAFKTIFNDPTERAQLSQQIVDAARDGLIGGAVIGALPVGLHPLIDQFHIKQTETEAAARDATMAAADATKAKERVPDLLSQAIDNGKTIDVSADKIAEVRASDPTAFSYVPDIESKVAQAQVHGGDVSIPSGEYFAKTSTEVHDLVKDDIRGESGLTVNEAKELPETKGLIEKQPVLYHGSRYSDIDQLSSLDGISYLTADPAVAKEYAQNDLLGSGKIQGATEGPTIYHVQADLGQVLDLRTAEGQAHYKQLRTQFNKTVSDPDEKLPKLTSEGFIQASGLPGFGNARTVLQHSPEFGAMLVDEGHQGTSIAVRSALTKIVRREALINPIATATETHVLANEDAVRRQLWLDPILTSDAAGMPAANFARYSKLIQKVQFGLAKGAMDAAEREIKRRETAFWKDEVRKRSDEVRSELEATPVHEADRTLRGDRKDDPLGRKLNREATEELMPEQVSGVKTVKDANGNHFVVSDPDLGETKSSGTANAVTTTHTGIDGVITRSVLNSQGDMVAATDINRLGSETDPTKRPWTGKRETAQLLAEINAHDADFANVHKRAELEQLRKDVASGALSVEEGRAQLEKLIGDKGGLNELPKGIWAKDGYHPDEIADTFGFHSGREMLDALIDLQRQRGTEQPAKYFEKLVRAEAERRVEDEHGRFDDRVRNAAIDAVMSVAQLDVLTEEANTIAGDKQLTREAVEQHARDLFSTTPAKNAGKFEAFARLAGKYGQAAETALLKGDPVTALQNKLRQLTNFVLAREARAFAKETEGFKRLTDPFIKNKVVEKVEQGFSDQIQRILVNLQFGLRRDTAELRRAVHDKPLASFLADIRDNLGLDLPVADGLDQQINFSKVDVQRFREIRDSIQTLAHAGRELQKVRLGEAEMAAADLEGQLRDQLRDVFPVPREIDLRPPGYFKKLGKGIHDMTDAMLSMSVIAREMDGGKFGGLVDRIFQRPLQEAKYLQGDLEKLIGGKLRELAGDKDFQKAGKNTAKNTRLYDVDGKLRDLTIGEMRQMMLHVGSEENVKKLVNGMNVALERRDPNIAKWTKQSVMDFIHDNATEKDWGWAQGIWNLFEKEMWPRVEENERRTTGVAPRKKEPVSIDTPFGTYDGGYAPLRQDPLRNDIKPRKPEALFDNGNWRGSKPAAGYSKDVTSALYAVDLQPGAVASALREMIHDVSFRQPLMEAKKFLDRSGVQRALKDAVGKDRAKLFDDYLKDVAGGGLQQMDAGAGALAKFMQRQRLGFVLGQLTYRASTLGKHFTAVGATSAHEVGLVPFAKATGELFANPVRFPEKIQQLMAESGELRTRWANMDRDLHDQDLRSLGQNSTLATANHWGHIGYALTDMFSAAPTYIAAKKNALAEGKPFEDAVAEANEAVRRAHGSGNIVDQPALMRNNNEFLRTMMVAMGFFNRVFQKQYEVGKGVAQIPSDLVHGNYDKASQKFINAISYTVYYGAMVTLGEMAIAGGFSKGEDWAKEFGLELVHTQFSGIPLLRDLSAAVLDAFHKGRQHIDVSASPAYEPIKSLLLTAYNLAEEATGGKPAPSALRDAASAVNVFIPLPGTGQAGTTGQFLWDIEHNKQFANNPGEMARGLLMGRSQPGRKHK